jgi:hypothetical protein
MDDETKTEWTPCLVRPHDATKVQIGAISPHILDVMCGRADFFAGGFAGVVAFSPNPWHVNPYKHSWEWLSTAGVARLDFEKTPPALVDWICRWLAMVTAGREMAEIQRQLSPDFDAIIRDLTRDMAEVRDGE